MGVKERPFCRFWIGPTVAAGLPAGGEVGGGITPELEAACARTPDVVRSKKLKKSANSAQRDAIAEKRSPGRRR
jgi:hypothetical protein